MKNFSFSDLKKLVFILPGIILAMTDSFTQDVQRITPEGFSYIDPEIYSDRNKLAYQTGAGSVYLADLDSLTGLFVSSAGRDILIDTGATSLVTSFNGPEFGFDSQGWAIVYTKKYGDYPQAWRARVNGNNVTPEGLTSGDAPRLSILASKSYTAGSIHLLYSKGNSLQTGVFGWVDEEAPQTETIIDSTDSGVRWIDGTQSFIYIRQTGPKAGQLFLYDTQTASETQITNDDALKTYSYGWIAPEYDELITLALLSDTAMAIYKDNGNPYWDRIMTLEVPPSSNYKYIGSPEAFVAGNKSYISFVTKIVSTGSNYVSSEVWLTDIEPDSKKRFMLRCDDGQPDTKRSDPESYIGENEVFIYYNLITQGGNFEIWRYAAGISTSSNLGMHGNSESTDIELYPNPASFYLFSDFSDGYIIYNSEGKPVMQSGISTNRIDVSRLPAGVYFLITSGKSGKFLKH
jgi:hypothetical protein